MRVASIAKEAQGENTEKRFCATQGKISSAVRGDAEWRGMDITLTVDKWEILGGV